MGPYQAAFKTKQLLELGVTHIVNATCREYTKREKHFKYLDIQIYDTHAEDAKKHFRITNRFIDEARKNQNQRQHIGSCIAPYRRLRTTQQRNFQKHGSETNVQGC